MMNTEILSPIRDEYTGQVRGLGILRRLACRVPIPILILQIPLWSPTPAYEKFPGIHQILTSCLHLSSQNSRLLVIIPCYILSEVELRRSKVVQRMFQYIKYASINITALYLLHGVLAPEA